MIYPRKLTLKCVLLELVMFVTEEQEEGPGRPVSREEEAAQGNVIVPHHLF